MLMRPAALKSLPTAREASSLLHRPQIIIGADDLAQFVFVRPVSGVGIGMKALDQILVAGLDRGHVHIVVEPQLIQGFQGRQPIMWFLRGLAKIAPYVRPEHPQCLAWARRIVTLL